MAVNAVEKLFMKSEPADFKVTTMGRPMIRIKDTFGYALQNARLQNGMTAHDLAIATGLHRRSIENWEQNRNTPNIASLVKLAIALDVSVDYLCGFSEELGSCPSTKSRFIL